MSGLTPSQLVLIARQHFEAGRVNAAEDLCRAVLANGPARADALHLAGLIAAHAGRRDAAAAFLRRAVELAPQDAALHAELGRICRRSGRLEEAREAFDAGLRVAPGSFDMLCELAGVLNETGKLAEAAATWRAALTAQPAAMEVRIRLGEVLLAAGRPGEAAAVLEQAVAGRPDDPAIQLRLGKALQSCGRTDEAGNAFRAAARLDPRAPEPLDRLGVVLYQAGRLDEAAAGFEGAIAREPTYVPAHLHLGDCLLEMGLADPAQDAYRAALALKPADPSICARLRDVLPDESLLDAAISDCLAATERNPGDAQGFCNLGVARYRRRDADGAIRAYRRALELRPGDAAAMNNLGLALKDAGNVHEAIDCLGELVEQSPDLPQCHSNLLYLMHFDPDGDPAALRREHAAWGQRHAAPLSARRMPLENDRAPDRRLRVGYVSPNFRQHSVGRFLTALFDNHDHERFEIIGYASVRRPDDITARIRQGCDAWVDATRLSDEALAERIRGDRIDILVDLTLHMADSRLLALARKPAPIQVTYLAYCSMTGLDTIDYRITDPYLGPRDGGLDSQEEQAEAPLYLPRSYWCYEPGIETPDVNALPALSRGHVTFAGLNNFCKASPAAMKLWAGILRALPDAELMLHAWPGDHRERALRLFQSEGVRKNRVRFFDMLSLAQYFRLHHAIDIALDSFPYPGGTTTCDALWMGVPTISLVGKLPFMRSGLSILSNAGLPELAVDSQRRYLETAVALAGDLPRLAGLRATMRDRLRKSPLMNGPCFALDLEAAYRAIWQRWCLATVV